MTTHYYVLPNGEKADNMKSARTTLRVGTHKFRLLVKTGTVIKVEGNLNNFQNVEPLTAHGNEHKEQNNLQPINAR